ncbi:MAG: cytochrome c [Desulfobacula sp.]|jgi:hypothetical protein|nr:cytochrome c [Desulfobacula sp.]
MKTGKYWRKIIFSLAITTLVVSGFVFQGMDGTARADQKKIDHEQAYKVYTKNCLDCHDSIADPEKPGKTRDEWYIVVNVMHKYGLGLTPEESDQIVDLLYDLRKGIEKEAG